MAEGECAGEPLSDGGGENRLGGGESVVEQPNRIERTLAQTQPVRQALNDAGRA